jgi:DNA repair exonuclease SbcCD nuclease subunit
MHSSITNRRRYQMERTRNKIRGRHIDSMIKDFPPSAIFCSDIHLRETQPTCRTDDFWSAQWKIIDWLAELQRKYNCPVIHAGDLFHETKANRQSFWKPSPYLISMAMEHLPDHFVTIYGQHDLPDHNFELRDRSGIYVLEKAGKIQVMQTCHWDQTPKEPSWQGEFAEGIERKVLVWHNFTYVGQEPWPGCTSPKAHSLLRKYKQFDLIVTGDNHQSFVTKGVDGNLLVNPGSLTRQNAEQINFKPKVYLWFAEDNSVEAIEVPIAKNVITREHIEKVEERDKRIDAFISRMDSEWELTADFDENLERFFQLNRVRKQVKEIIYKAKEYVND